LGRPVLDPFASMPPWRADGIAAGR
jgi:hypothetical protein